MTVNNLYKGYVPFFKPLRDGALVGVCHHARRQPNWDEDGPEFIWEDGILWTRNTAFLGTMRVEGVMRGRSAANFDVRFSTHIAATMFMTDAVPLLRGKAKMQSDGTILGVWSVCKRGANYGVRLHDTPGSAVYTTSNWWVGDLAERVFREITQREEKDGRQ